MDQPQLYESLTKVLGPEEQSIVQQVVNKAEEIEREAATNGGVPPVSQ